MGKSRGTVEATEYTGRPVTILTARTDLYDQILDWCEEFELDARIIPSFTRTCPSAAGEYGEELANHLLRIYARGVSSELIHDPDTLEQPLPCEAGGKCKYRRQMERLTPGAHDVLIGHYTHAFVPKVIEGRVVAIDEFPESAYISTLDNDVLPTAVTTWLQEKEAIPYHGFSDLMTNRGDSAKRDETIAWFDQQGVQSDQPSAVESELVHADVPLAVFTLLIGESLGNGWRRASLGENRIGVFNGKENKVDILRQPDFEPAEKVLALDGTPTIDLWELVLGISLEQREVLSEMERKAYIWNALNHRVYQTTEARKPYSSGNYVSVQQDHALITAIRRHHGQKPALITSKKALEGGGSNQNQCYEDAGVLGQVSAYEYRGNLIGSNQFKHERVGVVTGSAHYGDEYIERWGALAGKAITPTSYEENPGQPRDYGEFGNKVRQHMAEHSTLQEILRFGRDERGATVYVHTSALPNWVPLAGKGQVVTTRSIGMRRVIEAAKDRDEWRTTALLDAVDIGERQVREHLNTLHAEGVIDRESEGRGYTWRNTGLHEVNEKGTVDLWPLTEHELSEDEVAEVARSTINTWEFRNLTPKTLASDQQGINPSDGTPLLVTTSDD